MNQPFAPDQFDRVYSRLLAYLQSNDLFVQVCFVAVIRSIESPSG